MAEPGNSDSLSEEALVPEESLNWRSSTMYSDGVNFEMQIHLKLNIHGIFFFIVKLFKVNSYIISRSYGF